MTKKTLYDTLQERGYFAQCTHADEVRNLLENEKVTFYIGFDPTADSLHVGHYVTLMVMSHLQQYGHRPVCLLGGGTGTIGDPSGRSDMRQMLTDDIIDYHCQCFQKQMARFIDFDNGKALIVNNKDWLRNLNYIDLLRDVGTHFSVNRMLAAECYKERLEKGLTFFEFNYMVMQAYDFMYLHDQYNVKIQLGGDDQWSNIIAGVELIRRKKAEAAYGLTINLLTKSDGKKMGKTASGALWLDKNKTSPYDFYQYWRNIDDQDVKKCLLLLTFLPVEEIEHLCATKDEKINEAKKILAFEVTKAVHGEQEAQKAMETAQALFRGTGTATSMPEITLQGIGKEANLLAILAENDIIASKGEGRRLIRQNGLSLNGVKISDENYILSIADFIDNVALIKKGKKKFYRLKIK